MHFSAFPYRAVSPVRICTVICYSWAETCFTALGVVLLQVKEAGFTAIAVLSFNIDLGIHRRILDFLSCRRSKSSCLLLLLPCLMPYAYTLSNDISVNRQRIKDAKFHLREHIAVQPPFSNYFLIGLSATGDQYHHIQHYDQHRDIWFGLS